MSKAAELAKMGEVLTNSQIGGRRNIVINGAMQISSRSSSATSITSSGYHALDRFKLLYTDAGTWTMSQSSTAPDGFANSLKLDCTSAKSSLASDSRLFLMHLIEARNLQQLKKGTSESEYVTLSFYVRSNKTGTYQVNIEDNDNVRIIGSTYTISSADTWERKVISFVGDTSGTLPNDVGDGFNIMWALVAGTDNSSGAVPTAWESKVNTDRGAGLGVNLADSTDNEWYITGVQLEVGNYPGGTTFEHRSFSEEFALCQRYCTVYNVGGDQVHDENLIHNSAPLPGSSGHVDVANRAEWFLSYPIKRVTPTITVTNPTELRWLSTGNNVQNGTSDVSFPVGLGIQRTNCFQSISSGLSTSQHCDYWGHDGGTTYAKLVIDSEL